MSYLPFYSLCNSLCLHGMRGGESTQILAMDFGFWIPEPDFEDMRLNEIVFPYYKKKGNLKEVIKNIEFYPTLEDCTF